MKIYQNTGKTNEEGLKPGTIGYTFKINYADIIENAYAKQDALGLDLSSKDGGINGAHWIIGKELYKEFLEDMKIKESEIEKLAGKEVIGFIHPNRPLMQGVKVK